MARGKWEIAASDRAIKAAKHVPGRKQSDYKVRGVPGLWLYVYLSGRKVWAAHYTVPGTPGAQQKWRAKRLGDYSAMPFAEAKRCAGMTMLAVDGGIDPVAEAKVKIAEQARAKLAFSDLVGEYVRDQRAAGVKTVNEVERALRRDAIPALGDKAPAEITDVEIEQLIDTVAARGSKAMARHLLAYLRGVFNHALRSSPTLRERYGLNYNPADTVGRGTRGKPGKYGKPPIGDRFLDDGEIDKFLHALEAYPAQLASKIMLKLLLFTGQRPGEVRRAMVGDLRLDGADPVWTMSASQTKNRLPHTVPLALVVADLFRQAIELTDGTGAVFPSVTSDDGFMGEYTAGQILRRMLDAGLLDIPPFTPKDLRTTVKTGMASLGVPTEISGAVLNHRPQGVSDRAYNFHKYDAEKRNALERWAEQCCSFIKAT